MSRVLVAVILLVCLAAAVGAPRGLLLALLAGAAGLAHHGYARRRASGGVEK